MARKTVQEITEGSVTLKVYFTPQKMKVGRAVGRASARAGAPDPVGRESSRADSDSHQPPTARGDARPTTTKKTYDAWTIVHYFGGKRLRKKFRDQSLAIAEARSIARRLSNGQTAVLNMTAADQASWARSVEIASPTGKPLELIASEYVEACAGLPVPLSELKRFYLEHHRGIEPLKIPELVKEFIAAKRDQNLSDVHVRDLQVRCDRFAEAFKCALAAVTRRDFVNWLHGLVDARSKEHLGGRSRNNYRAGVLNLVEYAKLTGNAPKEWNELTTVPPAKVPRGEIEIWRVSEMRKLLDGAESALASRKLTFDLIPYLTIGAFAGPRQAELGRLDWRRNVKLDTGYIVLEADITKTDTGRKTPITPNLALWLRPYAASFGRVVRYNNISNALVKLARYVGLTWRHNALRHSFITYRVAATANVPQIALEAGNSVQEIHDSYLAFAITQQEARQWFDILPSDAGQKILALDFGAGRPAIPERLQLPARSGDPGPS